MGQIETKATKEYSCRWAIGQLTLVEHALCPLDPRSSLVPNLAFDTCYTFTDQHRHQKHAKVRITSPCGLSAHDELYLWGLLALTLGQNDAGPELHATPHYCLRQLSLIDACEQRGGRQYRQFAEAVERLSLVRYRCERFYDPMRGEHRKVGFGFFSYSLPIDPQSSRAWRIAWDPIFFELVRPAGGSLHFDLETYRRLDPASRRLFLLLGKIFHRRRTTPRFDLKHLAVNVLGLGPSLDTRDLRSKVCRVIARLTEAGLVAGSCFEKQAPGEYTLRLVRGRYFEDRYRKETALITMESPLVEPLRQIGVEDSAIGWLLRSFPAAVLREWTDITLAALERHGSKFFKRSPAAYLVDNVKQAAQGKRTPPDWWYDLRKEESRHRSRIRPRNANVTIEPETDLGEECRAIFDQLAQEMFGHFSAAGQSDEAARANAQKFAQEYVRRRGALPPTLPLGKLVR